MASTRKFQNPIQGSSKVLNTYGSGVSLVMGTVGREDDVRRFILSAAAQTWKDIELIIVDQNSDERLAPFVHEGRELGLDIVHLRHSPPNLSAARNRGIAAATRGVIAFPDDDCWYDPGVIERVTQAFGENGTCAGVVARWHEEDPVGRPAHDFDLSLWRGFKGGTASSITLFLRRDLFESLGGFDERLGVSRWFGAGEETDFVLRALHAGYRFRYCPDALVHHAFSPRPVGRLGEACARARSRERGIGALYAKHRLDSSVIARGFVAPLAKNLMPPRSLRNMAIGAAVSLGRIEGYLRWCRVEHQVRGGVLR
ncbi:MAG: glycosyltransferase family 2 protein [Betaproteobacteria bacterium]|nr:glycosyltransferase family 2 protein [Betaproteobacteria bacterium]